MALQLVLVEGRALSLRLPLGRAGTLGWGSDVAVQGRRGVSTAPARAPSLPGHTAPCERETTHTGARLCQLQPCPVLRLISSPGVQSQPCLPRWWQQLPGGHLQDQKPHGHPALRVCPRVHREHRGAASVAHREQQCREGRPRCARHLRSSETAGSPRQCGASSWLLNCPAAFFPDLRVTLSRAAGCGRSLCRGML